MPDDWREQLGDLKDNEQLKSFNSITDLANAFITKGDWKKDLGDLGTHERIAKVGSVKELAESVINTPPPRKLPATVDEYKLPENTKVKGLRTMALKNQLSQEQLDGILRFNTDATKAALADIRAKQQEAIGKLKTDWGDKYNEHVNLAQRAFQHFDDETGSMKQFLTESRAGDNPTVLRFMHNVGKMLQEDGYLKSDDRTVDKGKSAAARLFPNHPTRDKS